MSDAIEMSPKSEQAMQVVEKGSSLHETNVTDISIVAVDSMESDLKLDEKEERVLSLVESKAKAAASICFSSDLPPVIKITKLVAELMKIMENVRLNGTAIKGAIKKKVAMELIHRLLKEFIKDRDTLFEMLTLYHSTAEHLLETMADVRGALHAAEKITSCCASIF